MNAALKKKSSALAEKDKSEEVAQRCTSCEDAARVAATWQQKASEMQEMYTSETAVVKKLYRDLRHASEKAKKLKESAEAKMRENAREIEAAYERRTQLFAAQIEARHEDELDSVQAAVDRLVARHDDAIAALRRDLAAANQLVFAEAQRANEAEAALREIDENLKPSC